MRIASELKSNRIISRDELYAIDSDQPCTTGLPNYAYTSEDFFQTERELIFSKTWTCIGNACSVGNVGDIKPVKFLGLPLIVLRTENNEIWVFHNVCSHRGNELVADKCNVNGLIRCPYHSWTYDLQGQLHATPHVGGTGKHNVNGLDKSKHGLREVRSSVWMDLIFVNVSENAPDFEDFIAPLQKRINKLASPEQFSELKPAADNAGITIEFTGNWKLCVENNLESYHLPWVHPDLNSISKLEDHYHFYGGDLFAGQGSNEYDHNQVNKNPFPQFKKWPGKVAEYPTLYPNVFLGLQCDHYWTRFVEPVSANQTNDHLKIYYLGEGADHENYESERKVRLDTWVKVFKEDIGVVEGMQRGRNSPAFSGGVFTPVMDEPSRHFARWVSKSVSN